VADFECIETSRDLEALSRKLLRQKVVAVDTEADSLYHYHDKTCLVQIASRRGVYLVDPLAAGGLESLAALAPVFAAPQIRKIFHAADYDLFVLKRDFDFQFANIFDTMICAQLLGYPSIGLAALAERNLAIKLPKDEQRSDWSARPLRKTQLCYAAADVRHLIELSEQLERELRRKKRLDWAREEFEALTRREWPARRFDRSGYLRIKGARTLDPVSLSVLRELYLVRDRRARERDRPPFKVLGNHALLEIAQRKPRREAELAGIKGVTNLVVRRLGSEVLDAVKRSREKEHGPIPKRLASNHQRRRMDKISERRLTALKRWRDQRASELELDPGVLCPNATLEAIADRRRANADSGEVAGIAGVKGWFAREFGPEIAVVLAESTAEA